MIIWLWRCVVSASMESTFRRVLLLCFLWACAATSPAVHAQSRLLNNLPADQIKQTNAKFPGGIVLMRSEMPSDTGMGQGTYLELRESNRQTVSLFLPLAADQPIAYARRGELIITLVSGQQLRDFQKSLGGIPGEYRIVREVSRRGVFLVRSKLDSARNPWATAKEIRERGLFQSVEPNQIMGLDGAQYGLSIPVQQWSMDTPGLANDGDLDGDVDGLEALSRLKFGGRSLQPVVVAVIDSGAAIAHPGLRGSLWINPGEVAGNNKDDESNGKVDDIYGWNFVGNNADVTDNNGHGSHVAGIVGAVQYKRDVAVGLAPNARLMILKVAEQSNLDLDKVISAIDYAVDQSAKVINMSLTVRQASTALDDAVTYASDNDVFTVAAAGNSTLDISLPGNATFPCLSRNLNACVSATNPDGSRASYSNYSTSLVGSWLLAAPGTNIWSTLPPAIVAGGYGALDGTSMAAPHIAGVAAVLRGLNPSMDRYSIRGQLHLSADADRRLNYFRAISNPVYRDANDPASYCNSIVDGTPRKWIVPFASSWEPYFDGTTVERSHRICTLQQLFAMNNYLSRELHFALTQDLDWMDINEPMRTRIGSATNPFQGSFNGAGNTLRNYTYDQPLNDLGLFAKVGPKGVISDFRMTNARLSGASSVGVLAGVSEGVIANVQVEGVVSGDSRVGGIVGVVRRAIGAGASTGRIVNSFFEGRVKGTAIVGGLAGTIIDDAQVENSFAKGFVTAARKSAGGLAGEVSYRGQVIRSLAIAKVQSGELSGGIAGLLRCDAKIVDSFSEFMVAGEVAGGLVGAIENASVRNSYSLAVASGSLASGGLVAINRDNSPGPTPGSFACTQTTQESPKSDILQSFFLSGRNSPGAGGTGRTQVEMGMKTTFVGWTFGSGGWEIDAQNSPHITNLPRTRTARN